MADAPKLKLWYQSKTVWVQLIGWLGQVAGFVLLALEKFGTQLDMMTVIMVFVAANSVQALATTLIRILDTPSKVVSKKTLEAAKANGGG